ncbi:hypothetical protein ASG73_01195 [Janibacter sp. Soil728]|uniref:hypothetical protein n=1 Tax=Janibacter sp. Soil728 TaxID=1736393 RepID=UPI0006FDF14F|nr:hypothetical protein [Janibacter sp. Soil728]KRE39012.1 hypothetical protein ASG73_01195 [Janibacter sp. Soil728]
MSHYSSPFAPVDRDQARLVAELRAAAQDDTRRAPVRTDLPAARPSRWHRLGLTLRAPRAH